MIVAERLEVVLGIAVIDQILGLEINTTKSLIQRLEGNVGDL